MFFSLIIPVYNRPDEVEELLESLSQTDYKENFEGANFVITNPNAQTSCGCGSSFSPG